jgi:Asp-tRNA(Asn)/Glu-tRNA(Gln) amidotransferase A subunit family amidase
MAGPDDRDPLSLPDTGEDYARATEGEVRGLRVAWSADLGYAAVDPEVQSLCAAAAKMFENLGCVVEEAHPGFENPEPLFLDLTTPLRAALCGAYLAQWQDQMDPILVQRVSRAQSTTAVDYEQASHRRTTFWHIVRRFFARYDLLLTPHHGGPSLCHWGGLLPRDWAEAGVLSAGLASVHVPCRHDWATSHFGAVRMDAGGVASGAPDRRPALRRCNGAQSRAAV